MSEYAGAAKKLLSVCTRLEKWFSGEKLYEGVEAQSDDEDGLIFRWQYRSGKFEYFDTERGWRRVINAHNPLIMARFISIVPVLHQQAKVRKEAVGHTLLAAADAGEEYLQILSGFIDDDFGEKETSDYEEISSSVD
jgi:hypothetical protein